MAWSKDYGLEARNAAKQAEQAATQAQTAAQDAIDAKETVATKWLEAVATEALRDSAYPSPQNGDTVRVTSTSTVYRYETGTGWVVTDVYDASAVDNISAQLDDIALDVNGFGANRNETNPTQTTQAIRDAISNANVGDTVLVPSGNYAINDTIVVNKEINFICNGNLVWYGTRDKPLIHFIRPRNVKIEFNGEVKDQNGSTWHGWENGNYIGILIENAFRCKIRIAVVRNFTTGVRLLASGGQSLGFFFNTFNIFQLIDNKVQLEIYKKDTNSWFNSNIFYDLFFSYSQAGSIFQTANVDRYCIKQTFENNTIPSDTNIFYNIRFDIMSPMGGTYTGIYLERAWGWKFENYRCELVANNNVKFAVLNCNTNQIRGMVFNPIFEVFTSSENAKVNLINVKNPERDYRQIFLKTGIEGNFNMNLLLQDADYNKRYRQNRNDYHIIENLYRFDLSATSLIDSNEKTEEFATTDRLVENGVTIGTSRPAVLYLKGLQVGDTINVELLSAVVPGSPAIHVKPFDSTGTIIDNNEVISEDIFKAIVASNSFWDNTNKRVTQSVQRGTFTFSINRPEVSTVAILFSGNVQGVLLSSNRKLNILKSIIPIRNNFKNHVLSTVPTKKLDGKFLPGDKVYNENTSVGQPIGWELKDVSGLMTWVSLGTY